MIGDGAMSAGMAYEAMNNAEQAGNRLIVILNDNDMSIAPPVGGLSAYLARMVSSSEYLGLRIARIQGGAARSRRRVHDAAATRPRNITRGMVTGGTLFEELGFYYVGPIDGHNLDHLIPVLENVRDSEQGPVLVHVVTDRRARATRPAENSADKYHGVPKFDVITGEKSKVQGRPARLSERVRRNAGQAGRDRQRASAPSPPPCPAAPGSTSSPRRIPTALSMSALPNSTA